MKDIIVFTININGYDEVSSPTIFDPNVRYILLTDDKEYKSDFWETILVDNLNQIKDLRKKARYLKVNSHLVLPKHDISIHIDANLEPTFSDTNKLLEEINFNQCNMMAYKHRFRNCLYEEANTIIEYKIDSPEIVSNQIKRYINMGFPKNYGLFELGFFIRKNNDRMKLFNETWWKEIKNNSGRDQLSHMFTSWYTNINVSPITIGTNVVENDFLVQKKGHKKYFKS